MDGYYLFPDKTTADTQLALAGFTPITDDPINFTHATGFGKFWGDEWQDPIGNVLTENPEDPLGDWIRPEGPEAVYFHCRMTGSVPSALDSYALTGTPYETYGEAAIAGGDES